ncbi:YoaK family protein [Streptomyces sp. NPDC002588]|uniref:YoaK family protein n=1 Tax=Streptomyces sp. NPDC002588 TaxID=3154419 RepID=UPI003319737F
MNVTEEQERVRAGWTVAEVHLWCMLLLTFSTGMADVFGYLALDKVFTGNMTGNVVILCMGLSGTTDLPVTGPLLALGAFMLGAALGGRAMRGRADAGSRQVFALIGVVGLIFGAAAVVFAVDPPENGSAAAYGMTVALAAAMGLQAAVARRIGVKDVTTVVVTSTITGLAADSRLGAGGDQPWRRRAGAIALIGAGATVGALLLTVSAWLSVAVPAVITVSVAILGDLLVRRHADAPAQPEAPGRQPAGTSVTSTKQEVV